MGVWWLLLATTPLFAAPPKPLAEPRSGQEQMIVFAYVHDPDGTLTIDDVAASEDLMWENARTVFSRNGNGALWLRVPPLSGFDIIDIDTLPDYAELYEPAPGAFDWRVQYTGDTVALSQRSLRTPKAAFRLSSAVTPDDVRYIKIVQRTTLRFSVSAWVEEDFRNAENRAQEVRILILGFVFAIILYNCAVSYFARDWLFALNALTISSFVFLDLYLTGAGGVWLWPKQPWMSNFVLIASIAGIVGFGSRFVFTMLREKYEPLVWLERIKGFSWAAAALVLAVLILPYWIVYLALVPLAIGFLAVITALTLYLAFQGRRQAQLLMVPLGISVIPGLALLLINIFTQTQLGWLSAHVLEITLMVEALCFSLVLATRMRMHQEEATRASGALAEHRARAAERFSTLQDQERARIASDLHDSLGHTLALAGAQLEMALRDDSVNEEISERLALGLTFVRSAIVETRRISHALHPATLAHLGWQAALRSLVDGVAASTGIEATLRIECPQDRVGSADQLHLLRLAQEALSNVERHAEASWCEVCVIDEGEGVLVSIEDNGKGAEESRLTQATTLGVVSMRQRAMRMGAQLSVSPRHPNGLRVALRIQPSEVSE